MGLFMAFIAEIYCVLTHSGFVRRCVWTCFTMELVLTRILEVFLFGFVTPILGYMLEERLGFDPSETQRWTTEILASHGIVGLIATPVAAHFAEKTKSQKTPLLFALGGCFVGTLMIALTPSSMNPAVYREKILERKLMTTDSIVHFRWSYHTKHCGFCHMGNRICSTNQQCGKAECRGIIGKSNLICERRSCRRAND